MKRIIHVVLLGVLFWGKAEGQQAIQYSLYMLNPYSYNPAVAGIDNNVEATGVFRQQWVGLEGAPTTIGVHFQLPVYIIHSGVGLNVENDNIGAFRFTTVRAGYNYIVKMGEGSLSFGLRAGIVQSALDGSKLRTPDGNYNQGLIVHNDNALAGNLGSGMTPTFEAGVYYKGEKLYAGVSANNLAEPSLSYNGDKTVQFALKRNYYLTVGTQIDIRSNISFHPSVLLKSDGTETQADFSGFLRYNDNIFLGGSFRGYNQPSKDAFVIFGGFKLNSKLILAYSYDFTLSSIKNSSEGTHEILLRYRTEAIFGTGKLPPIIYNPRF